MISLRQTKISDNWDGMCTALQIQIRIQIQLHFVYNINILRERVRIRVCIQINKFSNIELGLWAQQAGNRPSLTVIIFMDSDCFNYPNIVSFSP